MTAMKTGGPIALYLNDLDSFGIAYHALHDLAPSSLASYALFSLHLERFGFWSWATISNVVPHWLFLEVLRLSKLTSEPEIVSEVISESGYLVMAMILKANRNNISLGLLLQSVGLLVQFVFIDSNFPYHLKVIFLNDRTWEHSLLN